MYLTTSLCGTKTAYWCCAMDRSTKRSGVGADCSRDGPTRIYFALDPTLKAFSIAFVASKIAYCLENDAPVLMRPPSSCTVHFQPVGLAVCTT